MDVLANKIYCGIDPGQKGGVAFVSEDGNIILFERMPAILKNLRILLRSVKITRLYIEKSQAMPGQGVVSMFNYGKHYGGLLALLELEEIPHELVTPKTWQKAIIGMGAGDPKAKAFEKASRLWPTDNFTPSGCRKQHNGVIDALLIAEYGRLKNVGV